MLQIGKLVVLSYNKLSILPYKNMFKVCLWKAWPFRLVAHFLQEFQSTITEITLPVYPRYIYIYI